MKSRHDTLVAAKGGSRSATSESALADFAEDLGRLLGSAERKAATWLDQRKAVGDELAAIRDKASALLSQLGLGESPRAPRQGRRRAARPATGGARKRRPMSAEARAKIAEAQRRRWAKVRRGKTAS